jgi:hypothetical protein
MELMALDPNEFLNIDISRINDNDEVCWEYSDSPDDEEDWERIDGTGVWCRPSPRTVAISTAAQTVHISSLKPSNMLEWYYRLNALFDAGEAYLYADTREGIVPIRITIHELKDHIGLRVETDNWSNSKFDSYVRSMRMREHLKEFLI